MRESGRSTEREPRTLRKTGTGCGSCSAERRHRKASRPQHKIKAPANAANDPARATPSKNNYERGAISV
nr:MAG TPA: hypothetical protein [Bacteriophage sp.]